MTRVLAPGVRLGFAVKVLGAGGLPSHDARRHASGPHLSTSLEYLEAILAYLDDIDVRCYRMATALAPYASHPDLPQFRRQPAECAERLAEVGAIADGRDAAFDRFQQGFELLSDAARARLVVENDDRTFGLGDVLVLAERIGRPVVWDILHHHCHDPEAIPDGEALRLALDTWPDGVRPKIHFSTARTDVEERKVTVGRRVERRLVLPNERAHADVVDALAFESFLTGPGAGLDFDVMLEAKAKDLAVLRLRDQLGRRGFAWRDGTLVAPG